MDKNQTVTIDGVNYNWDELSDKAKNLIVSLQTVNAEMARLRNLLAFCEVARTSYAAELQKEVMGNP